MGGNDNVGHSYGSMHRDRTCLLGFPLQFHCGGQDLFEMLRLTLQSHSIEGIVPGLPTNAGRQQLSAGCDCSPAATSRGRRTLPAMPERDATVTFRYVK